ncbi:tetratricopeptide repeat protein [Kordia sp.]|uniref:tetratricopeptide repeat protein n=1 Tax=Kordia sp. TaxID=1965332 RepID=UPI003B58BAA6
MRYLYIVLLLGIFSFANAQSAKELLESALTKKEQLKFHEGIQLCEQAIAIDSTLIDAYFYKAGFHTALINKRNAAEDYKNYKAAVANYTKVITLNPKHAQAFFYRGGAHDAIGFLDEAMVDYIAAIKIEENQPEVYNSLGVCYAKKGKVEIAMSYFDKAISYDKSYGKAYSNKGNIYDMKREITKACKNWKKAITLGYTGNKRRYEAKCKQ